MSLGRHHRASRGSVRSAAALPIFMAWLVGQPASAESGLEIVLALPSGAQHLAVAEDIRAGARQALASLADTVPSLAASIVLREVEAGCGRSEAIAAARSIAATSPALVVGHPCAQGAVAAAPIYAQSAVLLMAIAVRHPALSQAGHAPYVYRVAGRDDRQGGEAGDHLARTVAGGGATIVHDRTAGARMLAEAAAHAFERSTGRAPAVIGIVTGGKEYGEVIRQVTSTDTGAVLFTGYPVEGSIVLRGLRGAGWRGRFLLVDAMATNEFIDLAGADGEGAVALAPGEALSPRAAAAAAIEAWGLVVAGLESQDKGAIRSRLTAGVETRAGGRIAFDELGDLARPSYTTRQLIQGKWVQAP